MMMSVSSCFLKSTVPGLVPGLFKIHEGEKKFHVSVYRVGRKSYYLCSTACSTKSSSLPERQGKSYNLKV